MNLRPDASRLRRAVWVVPVVVLVVLGWLVWSWMHGGKSSATPAVEVKELPVGTIIEAGCYPADGCLLWWAPDTDKLWRIHAGDEAGWEAAKADGAILVKVEP